MHTSARPDKPRILVVEDQAELRAMLRRLIEDMGFDVDEATNRQDGLAMLTEDHDIGVVVLDLGLPPATHDFSEGIALLKEATKRSALLQCIVLTGQTSSEATLRAIEFGATDFLNKPILPAQLQYSVERAVLYYRKSLQLFKDDKIPLHIVADAASENSAKDLRGQTMDLLLRTILTETNHNVSESARRLNITREQMYYYITKHQIQR